MSSFKRNILVGITVAVALGLLGWMTLRFSDAPLSLFAKPQMPVTFVASSAEGLGEGSPITYKGVTVGRVMGVRRSDDQRYVVINALVDQIPPLPANVEGRIRTQLIGGGSSISLALVDTHAAAANTQPTTMPSWMAGERPEPLPMGELQPRQELVARYLGFDIMPREFTDLAMELRDTGAELRKLSQKFRESEIIPNLASTVLSLKQDADKAGRVLDHVNQLVGDPKIQQDVREAVANFRATSESARTIGLKLEQLSDKADTKLEELAGGGNKVLASAQTQVDELGQQIGHRMAQVAKILENLESASRKLNEGKGSAAQLINNPALYENLLDTSKELNLTLAGLRRLVEQWEQEGVPLRLGGKR